MNDLAQVNDFTGDVCVYEVDHESARRYEWLGTAFQERRSNRCVDILAVESLIAALSDAEFVP